MNPGQRWIAGVIVLLVGNALAVAWLLVKAGPASQRRVIPNYYEAAANYNQQIDQQRENARLGWQVALTGTPSRFVLRVQIPGMEWTDARGREFQARVIARHRTQPNYDREAQLQFSEGVFAGATQLQHGLYDVEVVLERHIPSHASHALHAPNAPSATKPNEAGGVASLARTERFVQRGTIEVTAAAILPSERNPTRRVTQAGTLAAPMPTERLAP